MVHILTKKKHEKEKEAAEVRGEAKAVGVAGALAGVGAIALEAFDVALTVDLLNDISDMAQKKPMRSGNKQLRNIALVTGVVALGSLIYAGIRHSHAHQLQQEANDIGEKQWAQRVQPKADEHSHART
jgi:uncharacterized membrane protein YebE (DUF533 family)